MKYIKSIGHLITRARLQRYLRRHHKRILNKALADAHSIAIRESLDDSLLKTYAQAIQAGYQAILLYVLQRLEGGTIETDISAEEKKVKEKSTQNEKTIKKHSNEREILLTDIRRLQDTYNWTWYYLKLVVFVLLTMADFALNTSSFQVLGELVIFNIIFAFGFAIAIGIAAHYFPKIIQQAEGEQAKKIRAALIGAAAFTVFLFLGWLRAKAIQSSHPEVMKGDDYLYSVMGFAILNFFFFICLVVFSWLGLPSTDQWLTKENLKRLNKELAIVNQKIAEVEYDTKSAIANLERLKEQDKEKQVLKQLIESLTASTILEFTNEITLKRIPLYSLNSNNSLKPKQ